MAVLVRVPVAGPGTAGEFGEGAGEVVRVQGRLGITREDVGQPQRLVVQVLAEASRWDQRNATTCSLPQTGQV